METTTNYSLHSTTSSSKTNMDPYFSPSSLQSQLDAPPTRPMINQNIICMSSNNIRLQLLEMIIEQLFTLRRPTPQLEQRLSELERLVVDVNWGEEDPLVGGVQLASWQLKLATWWTEYSYLELRSKDKSEGFEFSTRALPFSLQNSFGIDADNIFLDPTNDLFHDLDYRQQQTWDPTTTETTHFQTAFSSKRPLPARNSGRNSTSTPLFDDNPAYSLFVSLCPLQDQTPAWSNFAQQANVEVVSPSLPPPSSSPSAAKVENEDKEESTIQLHERLMKQLSALKMVFAAKDNSNCNLLDIDALKSLLHLTTLVDKEAAVYRYNAQFQDALFEEAFGKLSLSIQGRFNQEHPYPGQRMLYVLNRFLKDSIIWYYRKEGHRQQKAVTATLVSLPVSPQPTCRYCRQVGHVKDSCEALAKTLCFTCNAYGHSSSKCPRKKAEAELLKGKKNASIKF